MLSIIATAAVFVVAVRLTAVLSARYLAHAEPPTPKPAPRPASRKYTVTYPDGTEVTTHEYPNT